METKRQLNRKENSLPANKVKAKRTRKQPKVEKKEKRKMANRQKRS